MNKIILLLLLAITACTSFEYKHPLDKDSDSYDESLLKDDDGDGVLNYEEDDDGDGVLNYRDSSSELSNDYFIEKEQDIIDAKENAVSQVNDGSLEVEIGLDKGEKGYAKIGNKLSFGIDYEYTSDIIKVDIGFTEDEEYDESYQIQLPYRSKTYATPGIKEVSIRVIDELGNVAKSSTKVLAYNPDGESEKPIISLKGDSIFYLHIDSVFRDPGFTVDDDIFNDNELAEFVYIDEPDDFMSRTVGKEFLVTYSIYDTEGNKTISERVVIINE